MTLDRDFRARLVAAQAAHDSMLCVGLDPEPAKFPGAWRNDPAHIHDFCASIVDAVHEQVCAFKPQIAHFAAHGAEAQLERLIAHIRDVAPGVPVILDAKRGDIGSTAAQYAREAFVRYDADAVTLSPFLGFDSIEPYAQYPGRGLILLCRTSNPGGAELQAQQVAAEGRFPAEPLYARIARLAAGPWNASGQLALVVGATWPAELARVRELAPTLPLLVPGIGAQGGDAVATVQAGWRADGPLVISSSRAVLYAGSGGPDTVQTHAAAARAAAEATRRQLQAARPAAAAAPPA
jgi:orotidine-5'-phosphate decarboxylase